MKLQLPKLSPEAADMSRGLLVENNVHPALELFFLVGVGAIAGVLDSEARVRELLTMPGGSSRIPYEYLKEPTNESVYDDRVLRVGYGLVRIATGRDMLLSRMTRLDDNWWHMPGTPRKGSVTVDLYGAYGLAVTRRGDTERTGDITHTLMTGYSVELDQPVARDPADESQGPTVDLCRSNTRLIEAHDGYTGVVPIPADSDSSEIANFTADLLDDA